MSSTNISPDLRDQWTSYILELQQAICQALADVDGKETFGTDAWERVEENGGGGITRTLATGRVFEKAGVNTSIVSGNVTDKMRSQLNMDGNKWFACGLSLVIHPLNPFVPTVHANWRYFEIYDENNDITDRWFGGGTDLTPYYLFEEDAVHFHGSLKKIIEPFGGGLYEQYKQTCDGYFVNSHRNNEMRGIGGVFYEHLRPENQADAKRLFSFQQANGNGFLDAYLPIINKRKDMPFGDKQVEWQEIRRGRYVEFNLVHDRGTLFGLKTNGRTESILMSLPPRARWMYDHHPEPGSPEDDLLQACLHPRNWVA